VFVENKPGALSEITASLAEADIDLKAFTIADKSEFGVLRFLSDSPTQALALLKRNGWVASKTPVISVRMANKPGSLATILKIFADAGVQVEYMYAFLAQEEGQAYVVFRVEEPENAIKLLEAAGVQ
jgi:hypothetical protein